jgi:hypothetical protein
VYGNGFIGKVILSFFESLRLYISCWLATSNIEIWKNGRMEIFKALCASFFNIQYSIAKLCFALGMGEAAFIL